MLRFISDSPGKTRELARKLGETLLPGDIVAFKGAMGAGKTTFTGGLAQGLGILAPVSSPTFALVNEYHGGRAPLYHFDLYRIQGPDDLESTGFYDYLDAGAVLAVEWSEHLGELDGYPVCTVTINTLGETRREILIEGASRFEAACG